MRRMSDDREDLDADPEPLRDGTRSPSYGASSSSPTPSLPHLDTPQWSLSGASQEAGNVLDGLSTGVPSDSGLVYDLKGQVRGKGQRSSQSSLEMQDKTEDGTYM